MIHSQFLDLHDRSVQSVETPFGNLVEQFPVGCVVTELHGASQRTGKVVDHRPMGDRSGFYPVVEWMDGITAFSSPDWELRKLSSPIDRLVFLLQLHQPDCQIMQNLNTRNTPITISTPGGTFDVQLKPQLKLLPAIPSPRYKKLMVLVQEAYAVQAGVCR